MNCPICDNDTKKTIYKLCDNMKIMGSNFPESPSYIAVCEKCGLVYMDTEATQNDFLTYYVKSAVAPKYYDMFGKADTEDYFSHLLKIIDPYMDNDSSIIDIAGSWGEFASYVKSNGYNNITVIDPNPECNSYTREKNIDTISCDSTDLSAVEECSADMIILNHALEHILDVKSTMKSINRVLKDDGFLFIEVPDIEGYKNENTAPYNYLTYEHVLHLSVNDIENLAAFYGCEIIEKKHYYKKVSNYPSIYAVLKKGKKSNIHFSEKSEKTMIQYIEKSKKNLNNFLEPLQLSGEPLILWGIGASTAILLEEFEGCNVQSLIDRNPNRQGLGFRINGKNYQIESPDSVGNGTIVILSIPYCDSIKKQIREMGLMNRIVTLK